LKRFLSPVFDTICNISSSSFSHGAQGLVISKFLPSIVGLLSDPTSSVRDAGLATLVEIYRHVGERLRQDLQKKYQVPPAK
jgi:CLIP-associating protein 1/2